MPLLNNFIFQVQILAYLDNVFDVHALMEDSELKTVALERVGDLEEELGHVSAWMEFLTSFYIYDYGICLLWTSSKLICLFWKQLT